MDTGRHAVDVDVSFFDVDSFVAVVADIFGCKDSRNAGGVTGFGEF